MRLVYVVPGPMSRGPLGRAELERRRAVLQRAAFPGTEVEVVDVPDGPLSIESAYEEYLAVPATLEAMQKLEARGVDGAIVGCFGDPGVDAARELTRMPVVGPGEAAMLLAASLGHRFAVVTVLDSIAQPLRRLAWSTGVLDKLASVRSVGIPVLELYQDLERTFERMVEVGRRAVEADGADTLILGCMTMAFAERHHELAEALDVPVVSPAHAALKFLEALVGAGLRHSKRAYPVPPKLGAS
ncbi:MAG: aspartate/glutamate racemase family protein [Candidatus Rokubacteria bacterium]|nr:aspartate/glutamate racemase family protein [Candidatus Rokubacteria bacterium]